jgi:hypothetical protein
MLTGIDSAKWLISFLNTNNGRAFSLPPTMTLRDVANFLSEYVRAHPELNGEITVLQARQALSVSYPCSTSGPVPPTVTLPLAGKHMEIEMRMQGEYANIDTKRDADAIRKLHGVVENEGDELIAEIESQSGNYVPPVLFVLASLLYKKGKSDNAIFWFNAGRLRANFDAAQCADLTARSAVAALVSQIPVQLRRSQFDDTTKLRAIIQRVVQWDSETPYNYDHRWINLHGLNALRSGSGDVANHSLSLPREEWEMLSQKARADCLGSLDPAINLYGRQKDANTN